MVDVNHGIAILQTRPPTPPKEAGVEAASEIDHFPREPLDTPDESPNSTADYFSKSSDRVCKRVDFSPWTEYHKPPVSSSKSTPSAKQMRPLPPSKECKSSKSILKPYGAQSDGASRLSTYDQKSFPEMLDDITRELAGTSRGSRLDAYMTLSGCLKAYEEVPDPQAMTEKMTLLTQFIRRDLCAETARGGPDTQLVSQAAKLLTIFLWTPVLADMLSDDFRIFILDRSIPMIEDSSTPKVLVNHYLHLLATQNFRLKIMSSERAEGLLSALDKVTNHVKGNGVVGQRLMIYQRLLVQAKPSMVARVADWLDHLFTGLLSNIKEIRSRAIAFGIQASLSLGTTSSVSKAVLDIFNRQSPEGKKFVEFLLNRLNVMISTKGEGTQVPSIWSVAILFLRSRRRQLEHWEHMKSWLWVIQKCFNSSDEKTKFQANMAWNRLVFAVGPDSSTGQSMIKMLRQPILAQLDRKSSDKHTRVAKQVACASYCTLLYYAFRSTATHAQLDIYWEEYIAQVLPRSLANDKLETNFVLEVLMALLGNMQPRTWDENRANENSLVKPEELPALDPRWIRLRAALFLKLFEIIFPLADWRQVEGREARIMLAWRSFTRAIGDAGSKEVKISMECMTAVAQVLGTLKRVWIHDNTRDDLSDPPGQPAALQRLTALVDIAIANLGFISFTEKRLILNAHDSFEVAETPSSRSAQTQGVLASPIVHLISILTSSVQDSQVDQSYKAALRSLIQTNLRSTTSRTSKLKGLREIVNMLTTEKPIVPAVAGTMLWEVAIESLLDSFNVSNAMDHSSESPRYVGQEYRDIVKILEAGMRRGYITTELSWEDLISRIVDQVRQEAGLGGAAIAVIEPYAVFLDQENIDQHCNAVLRYAPAILKQVVWPNSRKELDHAQRILWGTSRAAPKSTSFNPFEQLHSMIDRLLFTAYHRFSALLVDGIDRLLQSVILLISSCPSPHSGLLLRRIQRGLGLWIEDANGLLDSSNADLRLLYATVKKLSATALGVVRNLPIDDKCLLSSIETLVMASLSSRHRPILNNAIDSWNSTFGLAQKLEYSVGLRKILLHLQSIAELKLPELQIHDEDTEVESSPFNFIDTQEDEDKMSIPQKSTPDIEPYSISLPELYPKAQSNNRSAYSRSTPKPFRERRDMTAMPTPRLRHDNSQIQFAAIESSPPDTGNQDSQLLTNRQKDVKERQQRDTSVIFPNLRSSHRPKSHHSEVKLPKLIMSSNRRLHNENVPEAELSPISPPVTELMNDFLGSSPTPNSSRRSSRHRIQDDEAPSSPLAAQQAAAFLQPDGASSPISRSAGPVEQDQQEPELSGSGSLLEHNTAELLQSRLYAERVHLGMNTRLLEVKRFSGESGKDEVPMELRDLSTRQDYAFSEVDVFVDAPASPSEKIPVALGTCELTVVPDTQTVCQLPKGVDGTALEITDLSTIVDRASKNDALVAASIQGGRRSGSSSDDNSDYSMDRHQRAYESLSSDHEDLVSTQIANELDRALSQSQTTETSQKPSPAGSPAMVSEKKRKRSSQSPACQSPTNTAKRLKSRSPRRSPRKGVQVVVERRASAPVEEEVFDPVVVVTLESPTLGTPGFQDERPSPSSELEQPVASTTSTSNRPRNSKAPISKASSIRKASVLPKKSKIYAKRGLPADSGDDILGVPQIVSKRRSTRLSGRSSDNVHTSNVLDGEDGEGLGSQERGPVSAKRVTHTEPEAHGEDNVEKSDIERHTEMSGTKDNGLSQMTDMATTAGCDNDETIRNPAIRSTVAIGSEINVTQITRVTAPTGAVLQVPQSLPDITEALESVAKSASGGYVGAVAQTGEYFGSQQQGLPSADGLLEALKQMLRDTKHVVLGPGEARQIRSAWMDLGQEIHEAEVRNHS